MTQGFSRIKPAPRSYNTQKGGATMTFLFFLGGMITGGSISAVIMALMFAARTAESQDQSSVR